MFLLLQRAEEAAIEATRQRIRDREITERKFVRVAEVDTAKYLDLALRNKKQTPEEKWAKLEMYCKNVDVKIGEYNVDEYLNELGDLQISYPACHLEKLKLRGDALGSMYNANGEAVEDGVVDEASEQKAIESVPVVEAKPDGERGESQMVYSDQKLHRPFRPLRARYSERSYRWWERMPS
ncbi:uncharacterized protein LOC133780639 [Humulus lupulus]|uniref:uncharacterized protein LOC133780639 n=1 Tax=Humulus lupulus TaxID=3486 RepID=UPI002B40A8EA|nr:uncharacterized protein LOC133780639 [Humulus lupulus]